MCSNAFARLQNYCKSTALYVGQTKLKQVDSSLSKKQAPGADPEGGLWGLETPLPRSVLFLNKRSIIIIWGAK